LPEKSCDGLHGTMRADPMSALPTEARYEKEFFGSSPTPPEMPKSKLHDIPQNSLGGRLRFPPRSDPATLVINLWLTV
jgi:hypothetical protein